MPGFYAEFTSKDDLITPLNTGDLSFTVNNYTHKIQGGPFDASLSVFGTEASLWNLIDYLGNGLNLYADDGSKVWWGIVGEVQVRIGALNVSVSLDKMSNRVTVAYSSFDIRKDTEWSENEFSIDKYGYKEIRLSLSDATDDQALKLRDTALAMKALPISNISFDGQSDEGSLSATIRGIGIFNTLDWRYYPQAKGLEQYTEGGRSFKVGVRYSASTLAFTSASTITDESGSGLSRFDEGDIISVRNSASNTGTWIVTSARDTELEVDITSASLVSAASGTTILIESGYAVAQSFSQRSGSSWDASSIHLSVGSAGSPTDNLVVRIYTGSSASAGALLVSGSYAGSAMSDSTDWIEIPLSASTTLANQTDYSIVVSRSGSTSGSDHYLVSVSEDLGYAYGSFQVNNGLNFFVNDPDVDMLFKVVGTQMTTSQIKEIVETKGQFLAGLEIQLSSGVETNQFRDGETTALDEIEALLETGTASGRRLLAKVTPDRVLQITQEPENLFANQYRIYKDRTIQDMYGSRIPLHKCPIGVWLKLTDVVPVGIESLVSNITDFFLEEFEYAPQTDSFMPRSREARDPWDVAGVEQG